MFNSKRAENTSIALRRREIASAILAILFIFIPFSPESSDTAAYLLALEDASAASLPGESMKFEPEVAPCPYAEEVKKLEEHTAQFKRALELGCEYEVDGSIEFEDPIEYMDDGTPVMGILNPVYGLTDVQMLEQGIISQATYDEGREAVAAADNEVPN